MEDVARDYRAVPPEEEMLESPMTRSRAAASSFDATHFY